MRLAWTIPALLALLIPASSAAVYQLGDTVQDFTLPDLYGNPVSLYDFAGDVIILNFFATWCPPCSVESPILEEDFWIQYQSQGLTVLGVDLLEPAGVVSAWVADLGLTYPVVLSPDWNLFTQFPGAGGIPYNAVIDQNMTLRLAHYGFDEDELRILVEDLLDFDPVAVETETLDRIKALYR